MEKVGTEVNVDAPNRSPNREAWFKVVTLSALRPACYPSTYKAVGFAVVDKVHLNSACADTFATVALAPQVEPTRPCLSPMPLSSLKG